MSSSSKSGLTLIETLTVLLIVGILVAFVTGLARHGSQAATLAAARGDLHLLADALDRYQLRFGRLPGDEGACEVTNLLTLATPLPGYAGEEQYSFSRSLPSGFSAVDPWHRPYRYTRRAAPDPESSVPEVYELSSDGPDGVQGTHDDIHP